MSVDTTKKCKMCGETKPLTDFHLARSERSGRHQYCKLCRRTREVRSDGLTSQHVLWMKRHGSSAEEYLKMRELQGNRCAICGYSNPLKKLCLDHDHATNKARGLLCNWCNSVLAHAHDDVSVLQKCIKYLNRSRALTNDKTRDRAISQGK